jgi:predicted phosphoadenosine phosphosulfate sulfurtransferase
MRVSSLIHETAYYSISYLQECEPQTYNNYLKRVVGVSSFAHFDKDIVPYRLPTGFKNWHEYRNYLCEALIKDKDKPLFYRRWQGQDNERWYKSHIVEILVNDVDGTKNGTRLFTQKQTAKRLAMANKDKVELQQWLKNHESQSS